VLDSATAEQLNSSETKRLLDTIDSLRDLRIGAIVDLPQIVVVGDQCSGKSSVLEAISRVHFPVSDGICTRFPTELVLRRAPQESTDLRIRFDSNSNASDGQDSPATHTPFHESGFPRSELPAIINKAKEHMGLEDGKTTGFSKHVLRVEIRGPDIPSLTLVDLPGIFHSGSSSQPQEWKAVVDEMVENYMKQKNSIILMVVSADISLSKHAILDMALQHDTARERTIGVITKVDLCPGSNLEDEYLRLARGQEPSHQLRLGWHVLRNRGPKEAEVAFDQRDVEEEKFLKTGVWSTLPLGSRGLIRDIESNLQNRQRRLAKLGATRANPDEMRDYLLSISTAFHKLAEHAVAGRYHDPFFGSLADQQTVSSLRYRKLRAVVRNLNLAFDITMRSKGAKYKMDWDQPTPPQGPTDEEILAEAIKHLTGNLVPLLNLYDFPDPVVETKDVAYERMELLASESQGGEFCGIPSQAFIMQIFRDQIEPWRRIAECHINNLVERAALFVYQAFDYILEDDERTRDAILVDCIDPSFDSMIDALKGKLDEIMRPYTSGHGLPLEIDFRTGVMQRKIERIRAGSAELLDESAVAYNTTEYRMVKPEDVINLLVQSESSLHSYFGIEAAVDAMLTHYRMSLRTFTDNVVNLVIENCLVSRLADVFSARVVTQMSDDMIERLAKESDEVKLERSQLADEIEKLKTGLQNCQRSRPRDFSAPAIVHRAEPSTSSTSSESTTTSSSSTEGQSVATPAARGPTVSLTTSATPAPAAVSLGSTMASTTAAPRQPAFGSTTASTTAATESSAFGSGKTTTATAAPKAAPVFGSVSPLKSPLPAFGSVSAMQSSAANLPAFGSTTTSAATTSTTSAFGSTTPATATAPRPSAFGSTTSAATTSTTSAFGSTTSAFGSTAAAPRPSAFGSTTPSVAPASTTSAFGSTTTSTAPAWTSPFGSTTPATAPAPAPRPSVFGASTTSAFGTSAFGSTAASTAAAPTSSIFGSTTPATATAPRPPG
ncbi:uncharacterized protein TRIVIDRAFT_132648, partial [Trichoderma virens Gv29-8]